MSKRIFDFVLASVGLAVFSPVLIAIAVTIRRRSPGPVLYRGRRIGRFGKPFAILKFRTMVPEAERLGGSATADDDPRLTPIGRWLRRYKLDELPQLWNVVRGEMSLVGPRPEVQKYVEQYTSEERELLQLRPGITDWATIWNADEGAVLAGSRDPEYSYETLIRPTKLRLQLLYLSHHSLWVDTRILLHTVVRLLRKDWVPREIASYGSATQLRVRCSAGR